MKWSFSAYDAYGTCPRKYEQSKLKKIFPEPEGEAALWGTKVHEALEHRVRDGVPLPEGMTQWESLAARLAGASVAVHCELELGITKALKACEFHAEDVWCRGIVDVALLGKTKALALDYKTGKRKLTDQLKLMALLLFAHYPELETVDTGFVWLKLDGKIDSERYERKDLVKLWQCFLPRLAEMKQSFALDVWPSKKNGLCACYCPVRSCAYNGNYERSRA